MFQIIEQLSKTKQSVLYNQNIQDYQQKNSMRNAIDTLVNDLSNEIVNISDDICRAKAGNQGAVDCKRTKRKIKRLENQSNEIVMKVNELELNSEQS